MKNYKIFAELDKSFSQFKKSKISILPVCYDKTSTWIKGAKNGPIALLEASQALELYDIETNCEAFQQGIYTFEPIVLNCSAKKMVNIIEKKVSELLSLKKFVVTVGGEHSISIGAIKAYNKVFKNFSVLQLDAHTDLRNIYQKSPFNHACVMARIKELCPIVQVGIRSMCIEEKKYVNKKNIFLAQDIIKKEIIIKKIPDCLSHNVYITIDLDVFDPSIMPSTGTPEPGGLYWQQVLNIIKEVVKKRNVIGFDVMELCPNKYNKAPDFLAAKLIYKTLSYIYKKSK